MFGRPSAKQDSKLDAAFAQVAISGEQVDVAVSAITDFVYVTDRGVRTVRWSLGKVQTATLVPWSQVQSAEVKGSGVKKLFIGTANRVFQVPAQQGDVFSLLGAIQARMI